MNPCCCLRTALFRFCALAGEDVDIEDAHPVVAVAGHNVSSLPVQSASPSAFQSSDVAEKYQRIGKILSDIGCSSKLHLFEENELDDDLLDDMTEEHFTLAGLSSDEVIMFRKRLGAHAAANASVEIDEEAQMLRDMEAMMQALEQKSSFVSSPAHDSSQSKPESSSSGVLDSISGGVGKLFSGVSFLSANKESVAKESEPSNPAAEEEVGFGKKLLSTMNFKIGFGARDAEDDPPANAGENEGLGKKLFSGFASFGKK